LEVVGYTLPPAFNPNIINYSLTVPYTVETISVVAVANNNKALLNGDGTYSLAVGETTIKVVVTAEDGTQRTYSILVIRQDNPDGLEEVANEEMSVWRARNALYIKSSHEDRMAYVYYFSGQLAKVVSYYVGDNTIIMPRGVYIVVTENRRFKVIIQ
jgi:hypothetical protein